uniref:Uncharacterized protein n=1 Tax=Arundo donax TaxID=35708 RepID=A0A0A9BCH6_ARUDO
MKKLERWEVEISTYTRMMEVMDFTSRAKNLI